MSFANTDTASFARAHEQYLDPEYSRYSCQSRPDERDPEDGRGMELPSRKLMPLTQPAWAVDSDSPF